MLGKGRQIQTLAKSMNESWASQKIVSAGRDSFIHFPIIYRGSIVFQALKIFVGKNNQGFFSRKSLKSSEGHR